MLTNQANKIEKFKAQVEQLLRAKRDAVANSDKELGRHTK